MIKEKKHEVNENSIEPTYTEQQNNGKYKKQAMKRQQATKITRDHAWYKGHRYLIHNLADVIPSLWSRTKQ